MCSRYYQLFVYIFNTFQCSCYLGLFSKIAAAKEENLNTVLKIVTDAQRKNEEKIKSFRESMQKLVRCFLANQFFDESSKTNAVF